MIASMYVVDAFAREGFTGNPAAVVALEEWLPDATLQAVAAQNNLSETAFFIDGETIELRWFTPTAEIDLCGHATLATAHALSREIGDPRKSFHFATASGVLTVELASAGYVLDLPEASDPLRLEMRIAAGQLREAIGTTSGDLFASGRDLVVVLASEEEVLALSPNDAGLKELGTEMVIATAPSRGEFDVALRVFAPALGIPEDPATGAAQCLIAPFWCRQLGVTELNCHQASARGGFLRSRWRAADGRVEVIGACRTFARAEIEI